MNRLDLKPETKCGFYIDEKRKKVWQIELNILEEFIRICDKYDINYSLNGGSLLGAIRHKGFIPWDDDIDIMMLRSDYKKFIDVAEKELKLSYFLQYYKTEKGYYYGHAQIRNINTTAMIKDDAYNNFNHGIFIDIFPLDNIPDNLEERETYLKDISKNKRKLATYVVTYSPNILKKIVKKIFLRVYWKTQDIDKELENFEKKCQRYNNEKTKECGAIGFIQNGKKYENEWFDKYIEIDFEYLKVKIIEKYDAFLTKQYGEYMKIPENKSGSMHGNVFFDTDKSYLEYEKNKNEILRNIN